MDGINAMYDWLKYNPTTDLFFPCVSDLAATSPKWTHFKWLQLEIKLKVKCRPCQAVCNFEIWSPYKEIISLYKTWIKPLMNVDLFYSTFITCFHLLSFVYLDFQWWEWNLSDFICVSKVRSNKVVLVWIYMRVSKDRFFIFGSTMSLTQSNHNEKPPLTQSQNDD